MSKHNLLEEPVIRHQLDEAERAAILLEQAARDIRERASNDSLVFRAAALSAASAAQELLLAAGMFEIVEVLS